MMSRAYANWSAAAGSEPLLTDDQDLAKRKRTVRNETAVLDGLDWTGLAWLKDADLLEANISNHPITTSKIVTKSATISRPPRLRGRRAPRSYLHRLAGRDGVFVISLARKPERWAVTSHALKMVGIKAKRFDAADGMFVVHENERHNKSQYTKRDLVRASLDGGNILQAITLSHMQVLEAAMKLKSRRKKWVAIFEDDVLPVGDVETWNKGLEAAWAHVPRTAKMVRLQWKRETTAQPNITIEVEHGFRVIYNISSGAGDCAGAYLVRRKAIPNIMKIFPCEGAIDICYMWQLFRSRPLVLRGRTWAADHLVFLDRAGASEAAKYASVQDYPNYRGAFVQNRRANDGMKTTNIGILKSEHAHKNSHETKHF